MLNQRKLFSVALQPTEGLRRLIVEVSRSHTIRHARTRARALARTHTQSVGVIWTNDQFVAEGARHPTQETSVHDLIENQTRDPSNQTAAYLHLRPHGHLDQLQTRVMWLHSRQTISDWFSGYLFYRYDLEAFSATKGIKIFYVTQPEEILLNTSRRSVILLLSQWKIARIESKTTKSLLLYWPNFRLVPGLIINCNPNNQRAGNVRMT
jgi:hypothetical protein